MSLNETVERNIAEYEEKIRQAKADAAAQRDEIKEEGTEQGKMITGKVRDEISKKIGDFKSDMEKEVDEARGALRDQTRKIAGDISEKVLGRGYIDETPFSCIGFGLGIDALTCHPCRCG